MEYHAASNQEATLGPVSQFNPLHIQYLSIHLQLFSPGGGPRPPKVPIASDELLKGHGDD